MAQEKLLLTDALDERDFLVKKIENQIEALDVMATKRVQDAKLRNGKDPKEFEEKAKSTYQQLNDNIDRYTRLDAAITQSNATTMIEIQGKEITRAKAIAIRTMIKNDRFYKEHLVNKLIKINQKTQMEYNKLLQEKEARNEALLNTSASNTKDNVISKEQLDALEIVSKGLEPELIDPLNISEKIDSLAEEYNALVKELDSKIKISNATTYVEF